MSIEIDKSKELQPQNAIQEESDKKQVSDDTYHTTKMLPGS